MNKEEIEDAREYIINELKNNSYLDCPQTNKVLTTILVVLGEYKC